MTVAAAMKHMASSFSKLGKFKGVDFRRWQKKMHFILSSMSVVYVLTTPMPEDGGENPTVEQVRKIAKWDNDDYVCRGLIHNGMSDSLFYIYQNVDTSKELWDSLEAKYMAEDASSKNFFVSNFTNYKMTDSRPVLEQYNELLRILGRFTQHKMDMGESIQDNDVAWWVDSRATVHVCKDRSWFKNYELLNDGSILIMGNELKALVHGHGCVELRINIVFDNIGPAFMSKLSDSILWHARLGHVHFKRMQDMSKDGLIPAIDMDTKKYEALDIFKVFKTEVELQQVSLIKRFKTDRGVDINSIVESRDVIFDEHRFSSVPRPSQRSLKKQKAYLIEGTRDEISDQHSYCFNVENDPKTFDKAMKSQDVAFWKEAINDEIESIMGNNTWVLTDLPPGCKPLACKWIFKRKLKVDGTVEKFKARLVIQGFKQKFGIDYFDTYAPVARISTIRLLIIMASIHSLIIHQMDVKTAFLNGELEDEVYMNQPLGFIMPGNENKDMGEANVILGIKIKHESNGIAISQSHYIEKVLKKFNYSDCTLVSTPLDTCEKLIPNKGLAVSQLEYFRVIGCLMYVMTCTRPDIAFDVGKLSRYTSNPGTWHWQAIQRVLKYLKKTMDYRLVYSGYPSMLEGYIDASWISNTKDNLFTSGWVFLLVAGKEAEWLKNLLLEILMWVKPMAPISICCDSTATLAKAYSQMFNGKSRHLGMLLNRLAAAAGH
nr:zinc finger, CCHC-type [Tanacetum cinerariifolium]